MIERSLHDYPLCQVVRNGCCGTCPKTLTRLIKACEKAGSRMQRSDARMLQREVLSLIMDTVCDCMIDKCWRGWCLDNVCYPLAALRRLSVSKAEKRELARLENEMRTLSCYFLD